MVFFFFLINFKAQKNLVSRISCSGKSYFDYSEEDVCNVETIQNYNHEVNYNYTNMLDDFVIASNVVTNYMKGR